MTGGADDPISRPPTPPREDVSYSEKYAGTQYGRPVVEPVVLATPSEPRTRGRFGCFGIVIVLIGLYWLIPGVIGFFSTLNLWYSGKLFDQPLPPSLERALGTAVAIAMVISVVEILIGLKILIRPGRYSLGCTGVLAFLSAFALAIAVSNIQDPPTSVLIFLGVYLTISVVFTLFAVSAAQAMD